MKRQLNKPRRWKCIDRFHLLYYLVILIVYLKEIKNYYIIYTEDEGRQKPKIILQIYFTEACAEIKRRANKNENYFYHGKVSERMHL